MMLGLTFSRGHVSMLGERGGGLALFLTNQAYNPLNLAVLEIILKALGAYII